MKTKILSFLTFFILIQPLSLGVITPVAHATTYPNKDFKIITGSYPGNGTGQPISGLGFQPKVVIIKGDTTEKVVWRSDSMVGDSTAHLAPFTANITGGVTTLDSDGFTVGASATVNSLYVNYYYIAFGSTSGDIVTGSYSGDANDDRSISGLGFQPALVWLKGDAGGNIQPIWRSSDHVGDLSSYFADFEDAGNLIQSFETNGFQIGSDDSVNRCVGAPPCTPTVYHYVAFKSAPEQLKFGTFPGDGNDDRDISIAPGFKPDYVWVKAASGYAPGTRNLRHKPASLPGDSSLVIWAFANATNHIQVLLPNGFQVGTANEVNELLDPAVIYRYVAWRHLPNSPASLGSNGVIDGSTSTNNTPSFHFNLTDPIVADTVSYRIQIDDSSSFSSPVVDYTSALGTQGLFSFTVGQGANGGSYTVSNQGQSLPLGSYYWRVLTIDSASASSDYSTANSGSVAFVIVSVASISQLPNTGASSISLLLTYILIVFGLGLKIYAKYFENRFILLPRYKELVFEIRKFLDEKRKY